VNCSSKAIRFDVGDYFNTEAIEIRQISKEKGRGVFAKHDIPPGTLLVVSKAFATCFSEELNNITFIKFISRPEAPIELLKYNSLLMLCIKF
jgi:SET domain-containing protein